PDTTRSLRSLPTRRSSDLPVTVQRQQDDHADFGPEERLDLAEDVDVILMRQDPPFDMAYVTATYLLERVHPHTLVVNNPAEVRSDRKSTRLNSSHVKTSYA